jgi:acyl-CoA dehydrogenase
MPPLPFFDLTRLPGATEEHRAIQQAMRRFTQQALEPYATGWDEAGEFPREVYAQAAQVGLLGLGYPAEFGGTPCDTLGKIVANIEVCRTGVGGLHASLMSHTIMVAPLIAAAQPHVQREVLPEIFAGRRIGALAVTEASGGSDVAQLKTRAERVPGGWRLNGSKMFITSGMRADHYLVAARTGGPGAGGLSLLLVDRDTPGFTRTQLDKQGWWCSDTAALYFNDCFVPEDRLVGEENAGWKLIMGNFNGERLGMAAGATAYATVSVEEALTWARERQTFGSPLIGHQVIRHKLVRMIEEILPLQSWILHLCQRVDAGESPAGEIALAKSRAARVMRDCAGEAIQILGGSGFVRGSKSERIWREVKVMMIGGGSEEVMADLAARQLGLT